MNVDEMLEWIRKNVNLDKTDFDSAEQALFWFVAMEEANKIHEECTIKDLASIILQGSDPIDMKYCKDWLEQKIEICAEEDEDPMIESRLVNFWLP